MAKKKPKPKFGDIVLVDWVDSCAPRRIWQDAEGAKDYHVLPCVSVGFWIKDDGESLILAQSFGDGEVGNITAIVSSTVTSLKVLSKARRAA